MADRVKQLLSLRSKGLAPAPAPAPVPGPVPVPVPGPVPILAGIPVVKTSALGIIIPALFYLSSFLFVLFLLLTFINFTVYPIFKLSPYDQGVLAVYTHENLQTAWTDKPGKDATVLNTPKSTDYTLSFDIFIPSEFSTATQPRVILYRGDAAVSSTLLPSQIASNLLIFAEGDTNDVTVAIKTNKGMQTITKITNLTLGTPLRLTIVYQPTYMEVYLNGKLKATKALVGTPLESLGQFWPPTDKSIMVGKLQYWGRALMSTEIQALLPVAATTFFVKPT